MALMLAAAAVAGCCMMKVNINFYDILFLYRHNYTLNNSYMKDKFCLMLQLLQAAAFSVFQPVADIEERRTVKGKEGTI